MRQALVGRQPIYEQSLEVYGYELLFRRENETTANVSDGDAATTQVILSTFHDIGLSEVVGRRRAFVNLTRGFIVGEYPLPITPDNVVLEVLEHVDPDEDVLEGISRLSADGFKIALDDFVLSDRSELLLPFADFVKIDIEAVSEKDVRRTLELIRETDAVCVAERVQTQDEFDRCVDSGFDLFQGFFLSRPKIIRGRRAPTSRPAILRLLTRLMDPECTLDELEELIGQDVTLTYRLLRHINAVRYGLPRRIDSVRETVVYLGRDAIRNLAGLFVLSGFDDRPHDLVVSAMLRGRMCELLAGASGAESSNAFFAAGMLSTLDALLERPMQEIVTEVRLTEELECALVAGEGPLGEALGCVLAYERGEWDRVGFAGLEPTTIKNAFLGAVQWAEAVDGEIQGEAA